MCQIFSIDHINTLDSILTGGAVITDADPVLRNISRALRVNSIGGFRNSEGKWGQTELTREVVISLAESRT